jgi:flagellar biogenesis protein FliO
MLKIKKILLVAVCALCTCAFADDSNEMVLGRRTSDGPAEIAEVKPAPDQMAASLRITGVWLLLLGLGAGALTYVARKRAARGSLPGNHRRLEVIERVNLGSQRELLLVKACDRLLVVNLGSQRELLLVKACDRLLVVAVQANQTTLLSDLPTEVSPSQPFSAYTENDLAAVGIDAGLAATSGIVVRPSPLQNRVAREYCTDRPEGAADAGASKSQHKMPKPWPEVSTGSLS